MKGKAHKSNLEWFLVLSIAHEIKPVNAFWLFIFKEQMNQECQILYENSLQRAKLFSYEIPVSSSKPICIGHSTRC